MTSDINCKLSLKLPVCQVLFRTQLPYRWLPSYRNKLWTIPAWVAALWQSSYTSMVMRRRARPSLWKPARHYLFI